MNISLIRADYRLIHGQVITKWVKQTAGDMILIVDDALSKDEFMQQIYKMAAPAGMKVVVDSVDKAAEKAASGGYGDHKLFVLFRDVDTIYRVWKKGFPVKELQIGGLGTDDGRIKVYGPIAMNKKDVELLNEMVAEGTHVYLHQVPTEPSMEYATVLKNNKFE